MKYDVAILAVFKNEQSFLPEWLDHYFNRNIDHIYLLNDKSSDLSVDIILDHPNKANISLLHTSDEDQIKLQDRQKYLYNKYYNYIIDQTKWIGILDLDEFCYSPSETDFKKIINLYDHQKYQELIIDWYWFGSNNFLEQPKNIIESFTKRSKNLSKIIAKEYHSNNQENIIGYDFEWCCKSFAKTKYINQLQHHYNIFNWNQYKNYISIGRNKEFSKNLSDEIIMFINHYLGSYNYYMSNKVKRGSCNNNKILHNNKKNIYYLINFNEIDDTRLRDQKYALQ
jgi:hypothetical protein